ncbi:MAG TPA: tetratricopeptide repeat protein, partial [Candidatus Tectomicrobia bacterium]
MVPRAFIRQAWRNRARANTAGKVCLGVGIVAMVALALTLWLGSQRWDGVATEAAPLAKAYEALGQGNAQEAETLFKPLLTQTDTGVQSQGYTGLAAVAFTHTDYTQTLDLAGRAATLDAESVYSHVLRGHVLLHQGKTPEAAAAYRTATE